MWQQWITIIAAPVRVWENIIVVQIFLEILYNGWFDNLKHIQSNWTDHYEKKEEEKEKKNTQLL